MSSLAATTSRRPFARVVDGGSPPSSTGGRFIESGPRRPTGYQQPSMKKACKPAPLHPSCCPTWHNPAASSQRGDSADYPPSAPVSKSIVLVWHRTPPCHPTAMKQRGDSPGYRQPSPGTPASHPKRPQPRKTRPAAHPVRRETPTGTLPVTTPLATAERRTLRHRPTVHTVQCGISTGCPQPAPGPVSKTAAMAFHAHCPLPCCNVPARRPSPSRNFPAAFTQRGVSIGLSEPTPAPTTKPAPLTISARGSPSCYPAALSQRGVSAATAAIPELPPTATSSPAMVQRPPPRWPRRGCVTRFRKNQPQVEASSCPLTPTPVVNPEGLSTPPPAAPRMRQTA
ncbi:extensin-like [Plutella xylostella]|uniref:extensin-like n=1 Tax=Plutella xylostella TaxID=51655 RepID=UPI0020328E49|nr:extensin-like [Plutella xylostella]